MARASPNFLAAFPCSDPRKGYGGVDDSRCSFLFDIYATLVCHYLRSSFLYYIRTWSFLPTWPAPRVIRSVTFVSVVGSNFEGVVQFFGPEWRTLRSKATTAPRTNRTRRLILVQYVQNLPSLNARPAFNSNCTRTSVAKSVSKALGLSTMKFTYVWFHHS